MTISKELFLSILAMDSYNRGYQAGLADDGPNDPDGLGGLGSHIGNATVVNEDRSPEAQADGFYAVAYDTEYGTVISYRGTDGGWDYLKGWLIGAGLTSDWTQADEALVFYTAVTGKEYWEGAAEDTIVAGHSLGGGLAGLVSALTGTEGYGLDYMPFGVAAWGITLSDDIDDHSLDFSKFHSISVVNEILESVRDGTAQEYVGTVLSFVSAIIGQPALSAALLSLGVAESELTQYFESLIPDAQQSTLESHSDVSRWEVLDRALRLHMADYLIQLQFAQEHQQDYQNWQVMGIDFFNAYFDEDVALAAGAGEVAGEAATTGKMGRAIAYSAIDEGTRVFGDTGIKAMFNDLDDLGRSYNNENRDPFLDKHIFPLSFDTTTIGTLLTRIAVQYAGALERISTVMNRQGFPRA